jgi:hypothetical protein
VTLAGSGNDTGGGSIASYTWTQTAGPTVSLSSATTAAPTFTAPTGAASVTLTFSLTVIDNGGLGSSADTVNISVQAGVTITGTVTFARIPFKAIPLTGLDYLNAQQNPARLITVEAINAGNSTVVSTATTDTNGNYSMLVPGSTSLAMRARAEMVSSPSYQFVVRDVDNSAEPYTYTGSAFNSGSGTFANLDIPSGWSTLGSSTGERASAPFAILDTVYKAYNLILSVAPTATFPVLTLDWAPSNPGGQTFYDNDGGGDNRRINLAGEVDVDTDEFDQHVIAHEFGHYIEDRFSRSDSLGGVHAAGDRLDMRVAFGEGFGYAFACMVLNDSVPRDSFGNGQSQDGFFSVETNNASPNPGWYNEGTAQEILWDVFDNNADAADNVALGFDPIWQVLISDQKTTPANTSIFPFITALKLQNASLATAIDSIVSNKGIVSASMDAYGTTETDNAGVANPGVLPIYAPIGIGSGPVTVRSTANFGTENKLGNHRHLRLDVSSTSNVRITAVSGTQGRDVDIYVLKQGATVIAGEAFGDEDFTTTLQPGTYVLDTYDCDNAGCGNDPPSPAAVDITVTITPN